jgi:predicted nucleic acid-binding protein
VSAGQLWQGPLSVDTMVATWLHTGGPHADRFRPIVQGHRLCMSFIVVGELRSGAEKVKAKWGAKRREDLEAMIRRFVILPSDDRTCSKWAEIHGSMPDQIGYADEWIAASALVYNLPVVTDNVKHFALVAQKFPALQIFHP